MQHALLQDLNIEESQPEENWRCNHDRGDNLKAIILLTPCFDWLHPPSEFH